MPVEKCCIPELSGAASAGESPPGTMGGPMDEGCQRLVRLFPTYTALQSLLSGRGFMWVFYCHVYEQSRFSGKHRIGAYRTAKTFHRDFERRQDLHLHSPSVDKLIPTTTRSSSSPNCQTKRALFFIKLPSYCTTYLSLPFAAIKSD